MRISIAPQCWKEFGELGTDASHSLDWLRPTIFNDYEDMYVSLCKRLHCFRFSTDLDEVLRNCDPGTKVFVVSGNYSISGLHQLGQGGALIGNKITTFETI